MQPKVLVVDDRHDLPRSLISSLESEGFTLILASSYEEALEIVAAEIPDIVILDLEVPVDDEVDLCRRIRQETGAPLLPVVILRSDADAAEKVTALEHGIDDLLTKPFDPPEVIARVRSLVRRTPLPDRARRVAAGAISMDLNRHTVAVSGNPVRLTFKEFALLKVLMRRAGRVVSREELLEQVWGYGRGTGIESRTLDAHIRSLRKKLGSEGKSIVTVRKVGYFLDLVPEWSEFEADSARPH